MYRRNRMCKIQFYSVLNQERERESMNLLVHAALLKECILLLILKPSGTRCGLRV